MSRRLLAAGCLAMGCLLAAGTAYLLFHNLTADVTASDFGDRGPAGPIGCSIAPWDAGLHGNDDGPGGEHTPEFSDEVSDECWPANTSRFRAGVTSGGGAVLLLGTGTALGVRRHHLG